MLCQRLVADAIAIKVCLIVWQMKSHSGRCYDHMYWVIGRCCCHCGRWNSHIGWSDFEYARCYFLCGRWNGHWVNCFIYYFLFHFTFLGSEMLNRTSSQMGGRWYLPMFLFRDGLLTLMYTASFISHMRFCSSLPTILKFSSVVV